MMEIPTIPHSASMAPTNVSLKLLVDTKGHRVLFAEAGKDFVDFLFNILSLPLGTVVRLLRKEGMVGCLGNLYVGIENLSDAYMQPNQYKDSILNPKAPNSGVNLSLSLLPNVETSTPRQVYSCGNIRNSSCRQFVADDPRATCPECNRLMSCSTSYVAAPSVKNASFSEEEGFVKGVVTYMVMDDLVVKPMSTLSMITTLRKFNIKEVEALEEKVIDIDMDKGVKMMKAPFQSKTVVLTDV